jgi:hypothetical protein
MQVQEEEEETRFIERFLGYLGIESGSILDGCSCVIWGQPIQQNIHKKIPSKLWPVLHFNPGTVNLFESPPCHLPSIPLCGDNIEEEEEEEEADSFNVATSVATDVLTEEKEWNGPFDNVGAIERLLGHLGIRSGLMLNGCSISYKCMNNSWKGAIVSPSDRKELLMLYGVDIDNALEHKLNADCIKHDVNSILVNVFNLRLQLQRRRYCIGGKRTSRYRVIKNDPTMNKKKRKRRKQRF